MKDWNQVFSELGLDPKGWGKHPYGAFNFNKNLTLDQIVHGMQQAQGTRDATQGLHKIVELYSSRQYYPVDRYDEVYGVFASAVRHVIFRGANAEEALKALQPYVRNATVEVGIVANELYRTIESAFAEYKEMTDNSKTDREFKAMFGSGKKTRKRKRSSSRSSRRSSKPRLRKKKKIRSNKRRRLSRKH